MELQPQQLRLRVLDTVRLSPPPAPAQHAALPLSGLDADRNALDVTFRTLRFFPPPPPSIDPHAVLPPAFEAALGLFPVLAGRLRDGHVVVGAGAVPIVLAESGLSAADVDTDCPGSPQLDRLAPPGDGDAEDAADTPVLALQATRFACGGVALGVRVAHALCDGAGATKFLTAAARFALGQGTPEVAPVWERRELLGPRRPPRVATQVFDRVLALDGDVARRGPYGAEGEWPEQQRQLTRECFHVSDARVEALRARIADEAGVKLTTSEVVAAFIWRARVKANGTSSGEVVKMVYSMNISKLVDPPPPDGYWGNVCVPELHRHDGVTAGAVSAFTDWRRLGHGEVDFGWGGPDSVLPLSWRILGSTEPCFLLPYGAGDERRRGGFKVFIALQRTGLAGFREEMQELLLQPQLSSAGKL
ncbi:unnamed protein product [Miscanthus lutarioriparius]|uniref:Uncharacterized protein n=1 Tax=Miscanthus lutarioriparius TaxID=422564 RepID=A0A811S7Y2_9POAL|nr:unnamed protein product [Miscanthus lutarioriparius]